MDAATRSNRLRFRIRSVLFGIAILAITLGGIVRIGRLKQLRDRYQDLSARHAQVEIIVRSEQQYAESRAAGGERSASRWESLLEKVNENGKSEVQQMADKSRSDARRYRADALRAKIRADYHSALRNKYRRAASRPWASVEADPPQPPWP
jgi:hypothetical protein